MFLYLPLEHSEDLADQQLCVTLCRERVGDPDYLPYVERHREIIERFGRFPHRNAILGRASTPEEMAAVFTRDRRKWAQVIRDANIQVS